MQHLHCAYLPCECPQCRPHCIVQQNQTPISECTWQCPCQQNLCNLHILKINHFDSNFALELFVPAAWKPAIQRELAKPLHDLIVNAVCLPSIYISKRASANHVKLLVPVCMFLQSFCHCCNADSHHHPQTAGYQRCGQHLAGGTRHLHRDPRLAGL